MIDNGVGVIVFSKWTKSIGLAEKIFADKKIPTVVVTGDVGTADRDERIDAYTSGGKPIVMLATVGAAGASLNLQRDESAPSAILFLDKSWVPAENEQAWSRVDRGDRTTPLTVVSVIAEETVDEYVEIALERKISNIDAALGDDWREVADTAFHRR